MRLVRIWLIAVCSIRGIGSVASRMRFTWDRALIRLQMRIFLESAGTKLYENV